MRDVPVLVARALARLGDPAELARSPLPACAGIGSPAGLRAWLRDALAELAGGRGAGRRGGGGDPAGVLPRPVPYAPSGGPAAAPEPGHQLPQTAARARARGGPAAGPYRMTRGVAGPREGDQDRPFQWRNMHLNSITTSCLDGAATVIRLRMNGFDEPAVTPRSVQVTEKGEKADGYRMGRPATRLPQDPLCSVPVIHRPTGGGRQLRAWSGLFPERDGPRRTGDHRPRRAPYRGNACPDTGDQPSGSSFWGL